MAVGNLLKTLFDRIDMAFHPLVEYFCYVAWWLLFCCLWLAVELSLPVLHHALHRAVWHIDVKKPHYPPKLLLRVIFQHREIDNHQIISQEGVSNESYFNLIRIYLYFSKKM